MTTLTFRTIAARANAASIDMGLVGILCAILMWSLLLANAHHPIVNWITGILLAAVMLFELVIGFTLGKHLLHLSVRRFGDPSQSPPFWSLLLRGLIRLLPVLIFITCLATPDNLLSLLIWSISLGLVLCYLTVCYLTLMRRSRTLFDLAASTVVIHRN